MTDMKPGSRWLLPVTHEKPGINSQFFLTDTGYHVLLDQPETDTLIPADRITELESEVAALKYALYMTIDPFAVGTEQAMELLGGYQPTEEHNKCP